jgi:hypothetical protein
MKPGRTLPLRLAPLPGEALDSWLDALAHRLKVPLTDLHWSLGLPGGPHNVLRKDDIPANRVVLLREHEAQAISAATGVPVPLLHAMTMARYDQRAIMIDHASRRVGLRAMWGRGRGSRYCSGCLADTGGRWQLRWRLTWSFACTTHQRLLADTCPACDSIPGFRASESHLPPSPGYCEAPVPLPGESQRPGWRRHQRCGTDLARTSTLPIPAGHPVLAAQQIIDQLIYGDTAAFGLYAAAPQATITALADLRAIAGRVITYALHREIPGDMSCDRVLAELHQLARQQQASQHAAQHRVGAAPPMAAAAALGLSYAVQVMTSEDARIAAERLRWLTTAAGPGRLPTYASGLDDWGRSTSDVLRRAQLAALGPSLRPGDQLRYRTHALAPAVRLETTGALARARRHAIPSTFWPAWTARLLPRQERYPSLRGPALAASLLLAGTRLTHAEAAGLLGGVITHWTVTTTLQRLHATPQWNDICTALTALAGHLDTQPAAIDYERRRHLDYTGLLPDAEWEDIRLRTERADHLQMSRRLAPYARHVLFTRLSGLPFTRAPFSRSRDDQKFKDRLAAFITALTPELAAELTRVAEDFLAHHQIRDEPATWQPPAKILDGLDLSGADLASLDLNEIHKLARTDGASAAAIARRVGTTSDAIQALLLDHPAPADPAGGARRRRARYDISREQLWDRHHRQGLSLTEIGKRSGYSRTAIKDLARTYDIPINT